MALKVTTLLVFAHLIVDASVQGMSLDDLLKKTVTQNPTNGTTPVTELNSSRDGLTSGGSYKPCGLDRECVPHNLCVDNGIATTGNNSLAIRSDHLDCGYNELCCDVPNKRTHSVTPPVPPGQHVGCGWRNPEGIGYHMIGDTDNKAQFGEFPWMLDILGYEYSVLLYHCGGSLIAANVALTSSRCVNNREANELVVRGGEWDTENNNEILGYVEKRVREIIRHENYYNRAFYNDVALLILDEPFKWQENIRPICLPEPNSNFDHSRCFATGWGKDVLGNYQRILKKVDLPIVPHATCQNSLRQTSLDLYFTLHDSFICAGGEKGKDTCKGDAGAPLVCPIPGTPDRFYQVGIVSWGVGCAIENVPGVYASVPYLREWISEKLRDRGIQFTDFTP